MRRLLLALLLTGSLLLSPNLAPPNSASTEAGLSAVAAKARAKHDHRNIRVKRPFKLATFNVLGHNHTARGGNKRGWSGSATRTRRAIKALNKHRVKVVGLQEFQREQKRVFLREAGRSWGVYSGSDFTDNSIAWRKRTFKFVKGDTILIPYFNGRLRPMPYVLLRSRATGQKMYFANFHNPASSRRRGNHEKWRDRATAKQIGLAHRLRNRNRPVFFTGDMNEREEYFCKFTANGDMHAANGGSHGRRCRPPQKPNRARIDWIFGAKGARFDNYVVDESRLVRRTTDHPLIVVRVH